MLFAGSLAIIASANLKKDHSVLGNHIVLGNATCSYENEEPNLEDLSQYVPPKKSIHAEFIMDRYEEERLEEIKRKKRKERKKSKNVN